MTDIASKVPFRDNDPLRPMVGNVELAGSDDRTNKRTTDPARTSTPVPQDITTELTRTMISQLIDWHVLVNTETKDKLTDDIMKHVNAALTTQLETLLEQEQSFWVPGSSKWNGKAVKAVTSDNLRALIDQLKGVQSE